MAYFVAIQAVKCCNLKPQFSRSISCTNNHTKANIYHELQIFKAWSGNSNPYTLLETHTHTQKNLCDPEFGKIFLNMMPKSWSIKCFKNSWTGLYQTWEVLLFCSSEGRVKRMEKQATDHEKISANRPPTELLCRVRDELWKPNSKKTILERKSSFLTYTLVINFVFIPQVKNCS